jgi:predicted nucleic acid-binding protein
MTEARERTFTDFMDNPYVTLVSVDPLVAAQARDLRKIIPTLKTPDAIIVATAIVAGADTLYTYDADDLLKLDGHEAIRGLRIVEPPAVASQLRLTLPDETSATQSATTTDDDGQ